MEVLLDVEAIERHRIVEGGGCEYLVCWADGRQTWEPADGLARCDQVLAAYWRAYVSRGGSSSYLDVVVEEQVSAIPAPAKPTPTRQIAKRTRVAAAGPDKIAVAKRVQANKQLGRSLARSSLPAAGPSTSTTAAPAVKPPPLNAKRSIGVGRAAPALTPVSETANMVAGLDIGKEIPSQRARKSTGGWRPRHM
ncbi:hypothetical protein LPJ61_001921 [Coemansia biformis]|uniref:Chromo domain-containing protein n=1 Tax=Coemansia biformis TaxID=1286918 RepID=A0A9W8CXN4_9FUNG|nr:hypothetical protein LPJ61_001921 [Coemansia biformis]